jgi:hypothetical protein
LPSSPPVGNIRAISAASAPFSELAAELAAALRAAQACKRVPL